jgi:hypothetical protein
MARKRKPTADPVSGTASPGDEGGIVSTSSTGGVSDAKEGRPAMVKEIQRDRAEEKKLDRWLARQTGKSPEEYPSGKAWERQRELFRVQLLYPEEHVVFRDHWEGEGEQLELVAREVLCHSPDRQVIEDYLAHVPREELQRVGLTYVEKP